MTAQTVRRGFALPIKTTSSPLLLRGLAWLAAIAITFLLGACGGGGGSSDPVPTGTTPVAPSISTQPLAQSVAAPSAATFTVVATGSPSPSYQWQASAAGVASFTDIAGATAASYTTPATTTGDSGKQYRVAVSNSVGSVTSTAVALTVSNVSSSTLAGYPYAVSIDSGGTLWVNSLPNIIHTVSSQFAGIIQSVTAGGSVATLAGSATEGFVNATGTAARFNAPLGVVADSAGNIYVADTNNRVVRKITPAGAVTTFAGSGSVGSADGQGTAASFFAPRGAAVDSSGNLYIADQNGNAIRRITPAGLVSTLAGGASGHADGTGTAATFSSPAGVAVDTAGNVYVADMGNNCIRKISAGAVVTTLAGNASGSGFVNGTGSAARFTDPSGLAVDSSGNVYVADSANHAIRKVTPAGVVTTLAGTGSIGFLNATGTAASFNTPLSVTVDGSGNVFIADSGNHAIRRITPSGVATTLVN